MISLYLFKPCIQSLLNLIFNYINENKKNKILKLEPKHVTVR